MSQLWSLKTTRPMVEDLRSKEALSTPVVGMKPSFFVIIGDGPNGLSIPLLVFSTEQKARQHLIDNGIEFKCLTSEAKKALEDLYKTRPTSDEDQKKKWAARQAIFGDENSYETLSGASIVLGECYEYDFEALEQRDKDRKLLPENQKKIDAFFTGLYSGCGGCSGLTIREVKEGEAFVCWNLD